MTAKEKAIELVAKFEENTMLRLVADLTTTPEEINNHNKLCALVVVNEMFKLQTSNNSHYIFWEEVREEIENL